MKKPSLEDLAGYREIVALMRSQCVSAKETADGLQTPLGAIETWSSSFRNAFAILLNSDCPMFLVWDCDSTQNRSGERILFYNDAYLFLLKATQPRIPVDPIKDSWTEGWRTIQADVEQVFTTGQALRREKNPFLIDRTGNGNGPLYIWSYSAVWDETGQIRGVFATGCQVRKEEIVATAPVREGFQEEQALLLSHPTLQTQGVQSSLQQAEAALRESEARFQAFMSHSPAAAWIADQDGCLLYLSPTYAQMFQFPQQDAVGKQIHDIYSEEFAQQFLENNRRVFQTGQVIETVETAPRPDGSIGNFLVYKFPIAQAFGAMLLGGVAVDITERQQTEELLRQREETLRLVTNALPVLIAYVDKDHYYRFNNQTYETWFGRPAVSFMGQPVRAVLGDAAYEAIRPYIEQVLSGQQVSFESQIPYREGGSRHIRADYMPHTNTQGEVEGFFSLISDISDRKKIEQERERFLSVGSDLLVITGIDGSFQWVNPTFERTLGWKVDEMTSRPWTDFVHPDDVGASVLETDSLFSGNETIAFENRYRHKDGSYRWFLWNARPYPEEQVIYGAAVDITERKQAEQALRRSEEWARLAIHVGRLGGWRLHLETNLVEMDDRMREIWGEPSDAVVIPLPSVIERMHPDDRVRVTNAVNAAIDPQALGTYEIDYRIVWNDGTERWVLAKGQAQFEGKGKSRRAVDFFGTLLDITDRKQAEEALRNSAERLSLALTAAKLGDWSWHAATDIVTLSEQAAPMFSIPPGPYMTWAQMQDLLYTDDREQARLQVEQAIADHSDYDIEYRVIQPDGTTRWIAAKGRAQYDLSGQVLGMLGVVQDITQRKQADAEREQLLVRAQVAREEAERANRIKDEFLAVLSHELRSPLNPILGWSKLLQQGKLDAARTAIALETIERNAKLQVQLVDDLLDISRILRGKLTLNTLPVSLSFVLTAAIDTVRLAIDAKAIQLKLAVDPGVGQVLGDAARLQQVVWNLLANAAKFTLSGGQITVTLTQVETCAQLQVKDTGKGIHPDFLPFVFEHFRQEDGATTRQFGGLGLGLAIVRQMVEMHGGSVQAESPGEGLGATFTVKLPLAKSGSNQAQTIHSDTPAVDFKGLRVLVVDDEVDMRELAAFVLEQQGATVITAASAQEALTVLDRCAPDVLLSDIGMPEIDGYMLMQQVRSRAAADGGQIPAIALTAYAGEVNQQQAIAAGFQIHLSKPIEPDAIIAGIARLLKR